MIFERIKKFVHNLFCGNLSNREKIFTTISLGWIVFIGYLTWFNGLKNPGLDKSFHWDEWIWFGVVPATVPYLFYLIWVDKRNKDSDDLTNKHSEK